jgi:hypothetical protein
MKAITLLLAVALAACGSGADAPLGTEPPTTTTTSTTTTTTATTTTSSTTTLPAPDPTSELPATWVGVTTDYEAVEVDTATGEIIRSLGQVATADDLENAECAACVNVIDAVWRTHDESHVLISECCEPAAGMIHILTPDGLPLDRASETSTKVFFWSAAPAPDSTTVAFLGYQLLVGPIGELDETPAIELDRFPMSNAGWVPGQAVVHWLESDENGAYLRTLDVESGQLSSANVEELAGWSLASLAVRASGDLVVVRSQLDGVAESALVLSPDGTVIDEFEISPGARLGGYESTGVFLIYAADDTVVRWIGPDGEGVLAEGFVFASW